MPIIQSYGKDNLDSSHGRRRSEEEQDGAENIGLLSRSSTVSSAGSSHDSGAGIRLARSESRQELIARIKREQRPAWLQNTLEQRENPQDVYTSTGQEGWNESASREPSSSLSNEILGEGIERPRSALHSGDFGAHHAPEHAGPSSFHPYAQSDPNLLSISPTAPWLTSYASSFHSTPHYEHSIAKSLGPFPTQPRNRAVSQSSLSNSFASHPPTSPLALQSNSVDLDSSDDILRGRSRSPEKASRRRTFSPGSLQQFRSAPLGLSLENARTHPTFRKHETYPRQAHQPRRSISSLHSFSGPQSPLPRSRRQSLYSDASPLQGAPMVGGYEESILRGRMSTLPSRPLDFVAQIGVLGKGNCKPSLRCPPHLSVPFPAVFYKYGPSLNGRSGSDAGPSPYVGMVDLENRQATHSTQDTKPEDRCDLPETSVKSTTPLGTPPQQCRASKKARLDKSKTIPNGGYRIPQQGQLQIIIKNPHKTAVKLFLVPYDLSGMQPGQKTFIRQRSYSAGPIIDMPLSARRNLGTDRPEASLTNSDDPRDRPVLRYLIHLHICSPSRGRFYLYRSIRVVFANRVPDGKEKLRNEVQLPEPRYTSYKSGPGNISEIRSDPLAFQTPPLYGDVERTPPPTSFPSNSYARPLQGQDSTGDMFFSFRRKSLAPVIPEASSHGSFSSGRSSRTALNGTGSDRSPKSGIGNERDSPIDQDPESPGSGSTRSLSPIRRAHGSGLLALQFRVLDDAARNLSD